MEIESDVFVPHSIIPSNRLGDILRAYMFFQYFDSLIEGPEFSLEELYASLVYQEDETNQLLYDIFISLLKFHIQDLQNKKSLVEDFVAENPLSLLDLFYNNNLQEIYENEILVVCWVQFLKEIFLLNQENFDCQKVSLCLNEISLSLQFNKILYENKIQILMHLINITEELQQLKDFHQEKSEDSQHLLRKKCENQKKVQQFQVKLNQQEKDIVKIQKQIQELEELKNKQLDQMEKQLSHQTFAKILQLKKQENQLKQQIEYNKCSLENTQRKLNNFKRNYMLGVSGYKILGIDKEGNIYWIFCFSEECVFKQSQDQWSIYQGNMNDFHQHFLALQEMELSEQVKQLIEINAIEDSKSLPQNDLNYFLQQSLWYKSSFLGEQLTKRRANFQEKKMTQEEIDINNFIIQFDFQERQSTEFLLEMLYLIEEQQTKYLQQRNKNANIKFRLSYNLESIISKSHIKDISDFNELLLEMEQKMTQFEIDQKSNKKISVDLESLQNQLKIYKGKNQQFYQKIKLYLKESDNICFTFVILLQLTGLILKALRQQMDQANQMENSSQYSQSLQRRNLRRKNNSNNIDSDTEYDLSCNSEESLYKKINQWRQFQKFCQECNQQIDIKIHKNFICEKCNVKNNKGKKSLKNIN